MEKRKKELMFVLSTGWAIRNYLYTGVIDDLGKHVKVRLIAPNQYYNAIQKYITNKESISLTTFDLKNEPIIWKIFRQARKRVYLKSRNSITEEIWEKKGKRSIIKILAAKLFDILNILVPYSTQLKILEWLDYKINVPRVDKSIDFRSISLFISTYASNYYDEHLYRMALRNQIKSTLVLLSWDHLSSKIIVNSKYHSLLVWNELSKQEIIDTLKSYRPNEIHVVGAPHFDYYSDTPQRSSYSIKSGLNLDITKKVILFTTMPQIRHDGQSRILEELAIETRGPAGRLVDAQIIVKLHPFDDNSVYASLAEHDNIRVIFSTKEPDQSQEEWIPTAESIIENRDLLYLCDVNVNIVSTMTLEAIFLNKPVVNIAFDLPGQKNPIPCQAYYEFDHFKPITKSGATTLVKNIDELIIAIRAYLDDPNINSHCRNYIANLYRGSIYGNSKESIVQTLLHIINEK